MLLSSDILYSLLSRFSDSCLSSPPSLRLSFCSEFMKGYSSGMISKFETLGIEDFIFMSKEKILPWPGPGEDA